MSVAFPTSIGDLLERTSKVGGKTNSVLDLMDDGSPRKRVLGGDNFIKLRCSFRALTSTEFSTLRTFLITNASETITWTVDGIDYSGMFEEDYNYDRSGNRFNVSFIYYAKEV